MAFPDTPLEREEIFSPGELIKTSEMDNEMASIIGAINTLNTIKANLSGFAVSGPLDMSGFKLLNVGQGNSSGDGISLDVTGKIPTELLPDSVTGAMIFKGTWDANTNTPTLSNGGGGGDNGDFFIVSVTGTTSIDGISDWEVGDWIINTGGTLWEKIDNTASVLAVFGRVGNITAQLNDYTDALVDNTSALAGATVKDALDTADSRLTATETAASDAQSDATQALTDAATANTNANGRVSKAGDTMTGDLNVNKNDAGLFVGGTGDAQIEVRSTDGQRAIMDFANDGVEDFSGRILLQTGEDFLTVQATDTDVALDLDAKRLQSVKDPQNDQDAATRKWIYDTIFTQPPLEGGIITFGASVIDFDLEMTQAELTAAYVKFTLVVVFTVDGYSSLIQMECVSRIGVAGFAVSLSQFSADDAGNANRADAALAFTGNFLTGAAITTSSVHVGPGTTDISIAFVDDSGDLSFTFTGITNAIDALGGARRLGEIYTP